MKRKLLIIISCTLFLAVHAFAQELIKDGGFESGELIKGTADTHNGGERGKWYFRTYDGIDANIIDEGGERGKVAKIERGESAAGSWFNSYLSQWNQEEAKKIQYRLTFKAKKETTAGTVRLQVCSATGSNRFFILKGREFTNDYAAHKEFVFTDEWETYIVDYDFNYIVKTLYKAEENQYEAATDEDLKSFYFVIYPTGNNTTVLIDDVVLTPVVKNSGLIQDSGFNYELLSRGKTNPNKGDGIRGVWYYLNHDNTTASIVNQGDYQKNAVKIERGHGADISFYGSHISQWVDGKATQDIYRLRFRAKGEFKPDGEGDATATPKVRVFMRTDDKDTGKERFFILPGKEYTASYAAHKDCDLTDDWQTFYIDYDFNYVVNTMYSVSADNVSTAYSESTTDQLENFYPVFYPQANGVTVIIDDVTLEKYTPSGDPAPTTGALLVDNDFENVTSIPRKETTNLDKYSTEMGEWYFYAEPGLGGINESTAEIVEGEDGYGKSVVLKNGPTVPSWWGHTLIQRFSARPKANVYRVSFYAKSAQNAKATVMVNTKWEGTLTAEFILKEGFSASATPTHSGARYDIETTADWQYYECLFDFSQKCNNYNSPQGVGITYAVTPTDEDFLSYCFLNMFNATAGSELYLDNIRIEEIDTYTSIRNPGFENDEAIPVKIQNELTYGAHSGNWVLIARAQQEGNISITSDEAYEGERSMLLNVDKIDERARYSLYLAMDLYEIPANDYEFSFYSKTDKKDIPFRLDVYVGENDKAIVGENGENLTTEGVIETSAGLKIFQTTTEWSKYSQQMTIPENSIVRFILRPNITGLGAAGIAEASHPIKYWFDNFELKVNKLPPVNIEDNSTAKITITGDKGYVTINNLENADILIYNVSGILVKQHKNVTNTITSSLNQGIYIIEVIDEQGSMTKTKVLVR